MAYRSLRNEKKISSSVGKLLNVNFNYFIVNRWHLQHGHGVGEKTQRGIFYKIDRCLGKMQGTGKRWRCRCYLERLHSCPSLQMFQSCIFSFGRDLVFLKRKKKCGCKKKLFLFLSERIKLPTFICYTESRKAKRTPKSSSSPTMPRHIRDFYVTSARKFKLNNDFSCSDNKKNGRNLPTESRFCAITSLLVKFRKSLHMAFEDDTSIE